MRQIHEAIHIISTTKAQGCQLFKVLRSHIFRIEDWLDDERAFHGLDHPLQHISHKAKNTASSHISEDLAVFCHENDIILYCLLANTTHLI